VPLTCPARSRGWSRPMTLPTLSGPRGSGCHDHVRLHTLPDMEMGHHLNFRDPDGIALEFDAPNQLAMDARHALASGQTTPAELATFAAEHFGRDYVPGSRPSN
jgi:hypothetical protein